MRRYHHRAGTEGISRMNAKERYMSLRFNVMTVQILGSNNHTINVNIEIGQIVAK
jgi:hypothetical protein